MMPRVALCLGAVTVALIAGVGDAGGQVTCNRLGYACATVTVGIDAPPSGSFAGNGRVTSEPPGIDCSVALGVASGVCSLTFEWPAPQSPPPPLTITLTARPAPDSLACRVGAAMPCALVSSSMTFPVSNGTEHEYRWQFRLFRQGLTVTKSGDGTGRVLSSPGGIDCGGACAAWFDHGAGVTLTAAPDAGAEFRGWTGACAGQPATCVVAMSSATATNAVFGLRTAGSAPAPAPAPAPPAPPAPSPAPDRAVDADIVGHRFARSALGFRLARVELETDERVTVTMRLVRKGKTLAAKRVLGLRAGRRVVALALPKRVAKGRARLMVELRDAAGNRMPWSKPVVVPRSGR